MGNEQKKAAQEFAKYWEGKGYEKGESQSFWNMLLRDVLGVEKPETFIEYEDQVLMDKSTGFIDGYIPSSKVLIEQKSIEKDLRKATKQSDGSLLTPFQQAKKYIVDLPVDRHPKWVITCNFKEFNIYDMNKPGGEPEVIYLKDLPKEYYRLSFISDTENVHLKKEMELSIEAGNIVGLIYDAFSKQYKDLTNKHSIESLNKLCVRIVFCLYAEDAELFKFKGQFHDYLNGYSAKEMRQALINLFTVLNTPDEERDSLYLTDDVLQFPYVNGGLFSDDNIEIPLITDEIRNLLLAKASDDFDWSDISPTIFGAVFESTLNPETRRSGGMHYTSIENIHKVIDPLFLDELKEELEEIKQIKQESLLKKRVDDYQNKLSSLTFLDPAAGSGNFLTETYISLRRLENQSLDLIHHGQMLMFNPIRVSISQFYGIEINDFAVSVAQTALWIAESQMMRKTEDLFNIDLEYLPLKSFSNFVEGNALTMNWEEVIPANRLSYIMGNPPFVGGMYMSAEQKREIRDLFGGVNGEGEFDYVTAWYKKACEYIGLKNIKAAFVSTNSICQGEQVTTFWKYILETYPIEIIFAYRTFQWDSEASLKAHVHCIIVGIGPKSLNYKLLFDESGVMKKCDNINPYLMEGPTQFIIAHSNPICDVPKMRFGSMPRDGGGFVLTPEEKIDFIKSEPLSEKWIKPYIGAVEFINNKERYCLWLKDADPTEIAKCPKVLKRIEHVRETRLNSKAAGTRKFAETPTLFCQIAQPDSDYIIVPKTSSGKRRYLPIGFMDKDTIASDLVFLIPDATLYEFSIISSNVHMAWMRTVCGRLKSDYRYSKDIVYNDFPWPKPTSEHKDKIISCAQAILDAREKYSNATLAKLYGEHMYLYPELLTAHRENDKAVMEAYGFDWHNMTESECVAELMKMYHEIVR